MQNKSVPHGSDVHVPVSSSRVGDDRLAEIYGLLVSLKAAVNEIRARLEAQYKSHYTVEEVAEMVGRSDFTVRRWISEERIKAIRVKGTGPKGRLLIPREQLDALITAGKGTSIPDVVAPRVTPT